MGKLLRPTGFVKSKLLLWLRGRLTCALIDDAAGRGDLLPDLECVGPRAAVINAKYLSCVRVVKANLGVCVSASRFHCAGSLAAKRIQPCLLVFWVRRHLEVQRGCCSGAACLELQRNKDASDNRDITGVFSHHRQTARSERPVPFIPTGQGLMNPPTDKSARTLFPL